MNIPVHDAKTLVIDAALRLVESGLVARTWGNVSCRISSGQFVITPSGKAYETLRPDDIVVCNVSNLKYKGKIKPSTEKGVHALIYAADENIGFVIHTHQVMATAVSTLFTSKKEEIARMPVSAEYENLGGGVPIAGYGLPGSKRLRACVGHALAAGGDSRAIIMARHGAVCFGESCDEAFAAALSLESACTDYIGALDCFHRDSVDGSDEISEEICRQIAETIYATRKDVGYVEFISDPAVIGLSQSRKKIKPLFDDFAQIIGKEVNIVNMPRSSQEIGQLTEALGKNGALLIRGKGAFCCGSSQDDAQAIAMILHKGGIAQAAGEKFRNIRPLGPLDTRLMRLIYLKKYAKRK